MSFWAFVGILAILGVMFGALYLSKIATDKEEEEIAKKKRIRLMRNDLIDIDELINTLLIYDKNPELLSSLIGRMERTIQIGLKLLPSSNDLQTDLADLDKIKHEIESLRNEPKKPETPESDRQIYLVKKNFGRTIRLLKDMQHEGEITDLEASNHRARLSKNSLLLEVQAYRTQGLDAKEKGDISSAANFYKHAKDLLVNSDSKFKEKMEHIKIVSKEISGLYVTMPNEDKNEDENKEKGD